MREIPTWLFIVGFLAIVFACVMSGINLLWAIIIGIVVLGLAYIGEVVIALVRKGLDA